MGGANGILDEFDPDHRRTRLGCAVRVVAARTVRGHGRVPSGRGNRLHRVPDDTFQEDRCRLRNGLAARNRAALLRIALNFLMILKRSFWPRMSIRRMRKMVVRNPARREPIMAL